MFRATYVVIDDASGKATAQGGLVKLGSRRLVLQGRRTY